jgi:hypothetical protein
LAQCVLPLWCGEAGTEFSCDVSTYPGSLHPAAPDFVDRLAEVNGLDFGVTKAMRQARVILPAFIPQIDRWVTPANLRTGTVAVSYSRLRQHAGLRAKSNRTLNERLAAAPGTRTVLLLAAKDELLELEVWPQRNRVVQTLAKWRPSVVVTPGWSVWPRRSALEHRYAMVRDVRMLGLLRKAGHVAIPTVGWARQADQEAWADWLISQRIKNIALDLQCVGNGVDVFIDELAFFRRQFPDPPDLFVNGLNNGEQLRAVLATWPNASFTADVVALAASGRSRATRPDGSITRLKHPKPLERTLFGDIDGVATHELVAMEVERIETAVGRAREALRLARRSSVA